MSLQPRRRQSGNIPATRRVANVATTNAPTAAERALDVLRCPNGRDHDARMEWDEIGGMRTGAMIAWCHTCRAEICDE